MSQQWIVYSTCSNRLRGKDASPTTPPEARSPGEAFVAARIRRHTPECRRPLSGCALGSFGPWHSGMVARRPSVGADPSGPRPRTIHPGTDHFGLGQAVDSGFCRIAGLGVRGFPSGPGFAEAFDYDELPGPVLQ